MDEISASLLTPFALPPDATVKESGNAAAENVIVTELSSEEMLRMEVIQDILKSAHDRQKRGQIIKEAAQKLGMTVRTIQRLVRNYKENGLTAIITTERSDKGSYRLDSEWQQFILKTYTEGNAGSRKMSRAQVALRVQARAEERGLEKFPSRATVYRVLAPVIEQKEQQKKKRNIGWRGSQVSHKTRDGQTLDVLHSNHVWQCDHTKLDIMLVDQYGEPLARPWLTKITDSYARCLIGFHLGFDAPSSLVVALALRQAILPKRYGSEYNLHCQWGTYGIPENLFTDGGKDFRSSHLKQIGCQLGFEIHLRRQRERRRD